MEAMEARLAVIEQQMNNRPTLNQIKIEMDRYFDVIKSMLDR